MNEEIKSESGVYEHFKRLDRLVEEYRLQSPPEENLLDVAFRLIQGALLPLSEDRPEGETPGEAYAEAVGDAVFLVARLGEERGK